MRQGLDRVMSAHRSNNAFIVYSKTYEEACKRLHLEEAARRSHSGKGLLFFQADLATQMESEREGAEEGFTSSLEALRSEGACDLAGVSALDLIDAFGNDTEAVLSMAKKLLHPPSGITFPGSTRGCAEGIPREKRDALAAQIGPMRADGRSDMLFSTWGAWTLTVCLHTHTRIHTHAHTHAYTYTYTYTRVRVRDAYTRTHIHIHTHIHTHTHTRAHTRTHARTRTHGASRCASLRSI